MSDFPTLSKTLPIPGEGSISVWPYQNKVHLVVFNKRGQRKGSLVLTIEEAETISLNIRNTINCIRRELLGSK